jgi:hypothetical protein
MPIVGTPTARRRDPIPPPEIGYRSNTSTLRNIIEQIDKTACTCVRHGQAFAHPVVYQVTLTSDVTSTILPRTGCRRRCRLRTVTADPPIDQR